MRCLSKVLKRSLSPGFAGEDNELFYEKKTMMIFGDAKATLTSLIQLLKKTTTAQAGQAAGRQHVVS